MSTGAVGLRELRQRASEIVRQVEAGDEVIVTVSGRPSARLVAVPPSRTWRRWSEIAELFNGPPNSAWEPDRARIDGELRDPWART
jgi:prevent-host-death family protein